jgi:hypothetical protein
LRKQQKKRRISSLKKFKMAPLGFLAPTGVLGTLGVVVQNYQNFA